MNWFTGKKEVSISESDQEQTDEQKRLECYNEITSDVNAPPGLKKIKYFNNPQNWKTYMNYFHSKDRQDCWRAFNDVDESEGSESSVSGFRRPSKINAKKLLKKSSRRSTCKSPRKSNAKKSTRKSKRLSTKKSSPKSKRRSTKKSPRKSPSRSTRKL